MKNKNRITKTTFEKDTETALRNLKELKGRARLQYIYDYFRFYILAAVFALIVLAVFGKILYDGQRDYRLRVCVVLNTENEDASPWFDRFYEQISLDGDTRPLDINQDQPFDYDNMYYYLHEVEVMTTISSCRMDVAVCGEDMYTYLLSLNACLDLTGLLPEDCSGRMVYSTAGLKLEKDGTINDADKVEGNFALDLASTEFADTYDRTETHDPLYAVIIRNTESTDDCLTLLESLAKES